MFKISKTDSFSAEVEISTPDEKGRIQKETVRAKFKRLDEGGLSALEGKSNAEICRSVLLDVDGMQDEDNQKVPWNEDTKEALLAIPPATFALASKFYALSRMGREEKPR